MTAAPAYPPRPAYFAMKFIRAMVKACVANEHGPQIFTLLATVAATEDSAKYLRAVTFYDSQLMPLVGAQSQDTLARIRAKAIAAGWLTYTPGRKGVPGSYYVQIPASAATFTDGPVDENPSEYVVDSSAPVRTQSRQKPIPPHGCGHKPGECADATATQAGRMCGPSLPSPSPSPEEAANRSGSLAHGDCEKKTAKRPLKPAAATDEAFGRFWDAYPRRVNKQKAREAFTKLNPTPELLATILEAIAWQRQTHDWKKNGGEFIPYPASWLNGKRWEDEPSVAARSPADLGYDVLPGEAKPVTIAPPMCLPTPSANGKAVRA